MTDNALTTTPKADLATAGQLANTLAAASVFADYKERKAANTLRRQANDLALFARFLESAGLPSGDFTQAPAWQGVTWGLVEAFARWQLQAGYSVSSINVHLATVKAYAKLAYRAGTLAQADYAMMTTITGYSHKEGKRIDEKRTEADLPTRKGNKKAESVSIAPAQAARLMDQPDTPQGRRDSLLMCLLLEHGLRVGEVANLLVTDFHLSEGNLVFYRPKVDKTQTHKLTPKTLKAARAYFKQDAPPLGNLWRKSASKREGRQAAGTLTAQGATERGLTKRVNALGQAAGIVGLSAHDCRHYWATQAARHHTPIDRLQDAGGWSSPAMPLRYIEAAKIANEGVKLD